LTEDGRLYLERARRLLADLDEADRLIAVKHVEPISTLSITAPVLFGQRCHDARGAPWRRIGGSSGRYQRTLRR
jgi:DNA-binding transcriptional LysR family regulator